MSGGVYPYIPSIFSIYLILVSDFGARYLRGTVDCLRDTPALGSASEDNAQEKLQDRIEIIQNVALDWGTRLGFVNSMIAAIISVLVLFSSTTRYDLLVTATLVLLVIFIPGLFWVFSHRAGGLVDEATIEIPVFNISVTPARLCDFLLISVNIILMIFIYLSQLYTMPSPP